MAANYLSQLGQASAGLGSALKNVMTALPQAENIASQSRLRSIQEAETRRKLMIADQNKESIANYLRGIGYGNENLINVLSNMEAGTGGAFNSIMQAAGNHANNVAMAGLNREVLNGLPDPVAGVVNAANNISSGTATGNDAPPPTAAQSSAENIARYKQAIKDVSIAQAMNKAGLEGKGMYQDKDGSAFNTFDGSSTVSDQTRYNANLDYKNAGTEQRKASADKSRAGATRTRQIVANGGSTKTKKGHKGKGGRGGYSGKLTNLQYMDDGTGNYFLAGQGKDGKFHWSKSANGNYIKEGMSHGNRTSGSSSLDSRIKDRM